jgi:hypothetical protein
VTVPVRQEPSINALVDKLYVCLRHEKSCTCGECSGGLNAVDELASYASALRVRADQAAEKVRAYEETNSSVYVDWHQIAESRGAEAESLRRTLAQYGRHTADCDCAGLLERHPMPAGCQCGLRELLAAADATQEPNAAAGGGRQ